MKLNTLPGQLRLTDPAALIATWFGAGLLRPAPGTVGSLAALPIAYLALSIGGSLLLGGLIVVAYALGHWATGVFLASDNDKDPSSIVIDEVVGQWIALLGAALTFSSFFFAFVAFRFFDIAKPWPVSWADQSIAGATGVMLDDILAGAYALVVVFLIQTYVIG